MKTIIKNKLNSSFSYAKKLKKISEDTVIVARRQTKGMGTKGRSFSSEYGGIYLTKISLNPCKSSDAFSLVVNSSMAVCKTLKAFNLDAKIKWPNDIIVNGKKICGILTENVLSKDDVVRSYVGIGLNANNDLPCDIENIATTMKNELNCEVDFNSVLFTLIFNLQTDYDFLEYKTKSCIIGKEITVEENGKSYQTKCEDILTDGRIVLSGGKKLSSAEITKIK